MIGIQLTSDVSNLAPMPARVAFRHRWGPALLVSANLLALAAAWFLAFGGWRIGGWATLYDPMLVAAGATMLAQFLVLGWWSSLSEPRSPLRWIALIALSAASAVSVSASSVFAQMWMVFTGRWGVPWGVLFWNSYETFMLVLCTGIVFLLAIDIFMWPCKRLLGCRISFGSDHSLVGAAHGFGLAEMFWWVGMAAAGSWLLRAMLENVLAESVAMGLILLVGLCPASAPATAAAMTPRRHVLAFLASGVWAAAYAALLCAVLWMLSFMVSPRVGQVVLYVVYFPSELLFAAVAISFLVTYVNCLGLRWCGARLTWNSPMHRSRRQSARRS